jgi:hypothetical protein
MVAHANGSPVAVRDVVATLLSAAGVEHVAITVVVDAVVREIVYASSGPAAQIEELTLTLGQGPGVDGLSGGPVLVADLAGADWMARWPVFTPAAVQAGMRALFALPLRVGAIDIGVLTLLRSRPGALVGEQLADALLLADTACALLLDTGEGDPGQRGGPPGLTHPEVHQATGMIVVQLEVSAAVALIRLRAYAYAHDRPLHEVAGDVVARRLRFDPTDQGT